ncbi:hypothetical protein [Paracoccus sp. PARArs4]|uniref:hypothetical protein n=1 Tax=Paracoccus sp. PARArs4 TaxID=2853442 RepID=UPI0024A6155B|nr:hypothetical protein [Paracoccus sp. PARArs4]
MFEEIGLSAIIIVSAGVVVGETVTEGEFSKDRGGYPCSATLNTDAGKSVILQLSDYADAWSLKFVVPDRASVYRRFFDSRGLRDEDAFEDAFGGVRIGERSFDFNDTSLFEIQRQDVDEKTAGIFSLDEQHNAVRALEAMADDGIEIQGLVSLDGTAKVLGEFRSCSYAAMGLQEGERVETDFRAEYRMIFERAFENWVTSMAQAEHCLATRFDDNAVSEVIDAAADAFYPGMLNFRKRSEYREDIERMLPMAKLSGMTDARTEGCLMAGRLADLSRIPVDRAIEEAAKLD